VRFSWIYVDLMLYPWYFCVLNQGLVLCSKPKRRKSCKFIQCLNKEKRDEDKSIKRIKIKMRGEFNLIHNLI
jgi:hypothetical protein